MTPAEEQAHRDRCFVGVLLTWEGDTEKISRCEVCDTFKTDEEAIEAVRKLRENDKKRPRPVGYVTLPNDCYEILLRYQREQGEGRSLAEIAGSLLGGAMITWEQNHPPKGSTCPKCNGRKLVPNETVPRLDDPEWWPCPACDGSGVVS
jgi:hypothetical protein